MKNEATAITPETEALLRRQRHDFINHVQVLHAYLQLGKLEKAAAYVAALVEEINAGEFCAEYLAPPKKKAARRE